MNESIGISTSFLIPLLGIAPLYLMFILRKKKESAPKSGFNKLRSS